MASLNNQLNKYKREKNRLVNLLKDGAATPKQIDDIDAEIEVLKNQIKAQESTLNITSSGINKDVIPLTIQISQINDQLEKSKIINPLNGSVLVKYVEQNEMVTIGKPMYKIADLSEIILRAYITGNQLPNIKVNQKVKVYIDSINGEYKETTGVITWISDKAEFTPKTIQTKDERANLVYAIKIKVINDGSYKIGMYGEIKF
ncbi:efflux RND transporter periplasmic adaptor subunit [Flavobacterium sp. NRK F10]|uniref:HlyD family secretion protein n=1 Tax=Flavobacterium sp. NRK F10 TaxID=2954931 RepID=UPI002090ADC5|nr:efflux RND transporter periplasmic adaptor subunit [Flavobacterium sp. NRK F10]MCO6175916.1 efflux RND transporter periplasmic adaptor subunit [Flavobacterium sp. NRK F10]